MTKSSGRHQRNSRVCDPVHRFSRSSSPLQPSSWLGWPASFLDSSESMFLRVMGLIWAITLMPAILSAQSHSLSTMPVDAARGAAVEGRADDQAKPDSEENGALRIGSSVNPNEQGQSTGGPDAVTPNQDSASAQQKHEPPPVPPHTGVRALVHNVGEDITKLPSMQNVYISAIGAGLALAAHPADSTLNARLMSHYNTVNVIFAPGKYLGDTPEQVAMALATFAFGRMTDKPKVSHLANDLLQAQILSEMLVEPLKLATQRLRPYQTGSCGLNCSFPSGHAAITFADATVIERHLGWKYSIIGYTIASYVAVSRLHDNKHFLSDVVFGAAVGTVAGRTVVHHERDYWAFTPTAMPTGGFAILATRVHQAN